MFFKSNIKLYMDCFFALDADTNKIQNTNNNTNKVHNTLNDDVFRSYIDILLWILYIYCFQ